MLIHHPGSTVLSAVQYLFTVLGLGFLLFLLYVWQPHRPEGWKWVSAMTATAKRGWRALLNLKLASSVALVLGCLAWAILYPPSIPRRLTADQHRQLVDLVRHDPARAVQIGSMAGQTHEEWQFAEDIRLVFADPDLVKLGWTTMDNRGRMTTSADPVGVNVETGNREHPDPNGSGGFMISDDASERKICDFLKAQGFHASFGLADEGDSGIGTIVITVEHQE